MMNAWVRPHFSKAICRRVRKAFAIENADRYIPIKLNPELPFSGIAGGVEDRDDEDNVILNREVNPIRKPSRNGPPDAGP